MVSIKPFILLFSSFLEKHQPAWRCSMYLLKSSGPFPKLHLQTWQNPSVYFTQLAGVLGKKSFSWKPLQTGVLSCCSSTGCFLQHRESKSNPLCCLSEINSSQRTTGNKTTPWPGLQLQALHREIPTTNESSVQSWHQEHWAHPSPLLPEPLTEH